MKKKNSRKAPKLPRLVPKISTSSKKFMSKKEKAKHDRRALNRLGEIS